MTDARTEEDFDRLLEYTEWANTQILETLRNGDGIPERAVELFSHLLRAQDVWYGRVESTEHASLSLWVDEGLERSADRLEATSERWRQVMTELPEDGLDAVVEYENSSGTRFKNALREVISHVVNHGTHHRAQIALILRQADITPPATDYIYYLRKS